jgi:hypothetical protein
VQQSPKPRAATPYETEVRVIVSDDRIFFGFECKDPHPDRLSIHTVYKQPAAPRQNTFDGLNFIWHTSRFQGNKNLLLGAWSATAQDDVGPRSKIGRGFKIDHPTTCWIATQGQ